MVGVRQFDARNFIRNLVFLSFDPLGVDAKGGVDEEHTKKATESSSRQRIFAAVICPTNGGGIIGDVEEYGGRIVRMSYFLEGGEGGGIVDDDGDVLEDID